MLAIKLKRVGKKHQASFRLVVVEKRSKLQGRFTEDLGWMDPRAKKEGINKERVKYWLGVGAQPTPTVWNLLVRTGVVEGKKIPVHKKPRRSGEVGAPTSDATVGAGGASEAKVKAKATADGGAPQDAGKGEATAPTAAPAEPAPAEPAPAEPAPAEPAPGEPPAPAEAAAEAKPAGESASAEAVEGKEATPEEKPAAEVAGA